MKENQSQYTPDLDHALLHRARQLIKGDQIHTVRTWMFIYERSIPGSKERLQYEHLLRIFIATESVIMAAQRLDGGL
jgi:hypothetical protein